MNKRFELINFLNAHDNFKDNKNNKKLDSFDVVELLNHYDKLQTLLVEKDQRIAELEEQLKNAIVPKFKIRQEVFYIVDKYKLKSGEILEIQIWDLKKDNIVYVIEYGGNVWCENELFATKEEAEAKLRELQ